MADLHQVQINEVDQEENISLEKQASMQEEAANQRNQTLEADPKEGKETIEEQLKEEEPDRPEWLDEKFESPEEMAKAYSELQKKMSSPKKAPAKKAVAKKASAKKAVAKKAPAKKTEAPKASVTPKATAAPTKKPVAKKSAAPKKKPDAKKATPKKKTIVSLN